MGNSEAVAVSGKNRAHSSALRFINRAVSVPAASKTRLMAGYSAIGDARVMRRASSAVSTTLDASARRAK